MNARVSKISLILFVVLLVLSGGLLSVAGRYWPWFLVMSGFAIIPLVVGPSRYRIWGAAALGLSVVLMIGDYVAGRHLLERQHRSSAEVTPPNHALQPTATAPSDSTKP